MREQNRLVGRPLPRRAVGSTLLLKGLEAAVAVILNADALDARNLYVAMTRGSKALTVCASSAVLNPDLYWQTSLETDTGRSCANLFGNQ